MTHIFCYAARRMQWLLQNLSGEKMDGLKKLAEQMHQVLTAKIDGKLVD